MGLSVLPISKRWKFERKTRYYPRKYRDLGRNKKIQRTWEISLLLHWTPLKPNCFTPRNTTRWHRTELIISILHCRLIRTHSPFRVLSYSFNKVLDGSSKHVSLICCSLQQFNLIGATGGSAQDKKLPVGWRIYTLPTPQLFCCWLQLLHTWCPPDSLSAGPPYFSSCRYHTRQQWGVGVHIFTCPVMAYSNRVGLRILTSVILVHHKFLFESFTSWVSEKN